MGNANSSEAVGVATVKAEPQEHLASNDDSLQTILVDCGGSCTVALEDVKPSMTVTDLHEYILEEIDDELLPGINDGKPNFSIQLRVAGQWIQPMKKQASRKTVRDIINNRFAIRLVAKPTQNHGNNKRPREQEPSQQEQRQQGEQQPPATESAPSSATSCGFAAAASNSSACAFETPAAAARNSNHLQKSNETVPSPFKKAKIFSDDDTLFPTKGNAIGPALGSCDDGSNRNVNNDRRNVDTVADNSSGNSVDDDKTVPMSAAVGEDDRDNYLGAGGGFEKENENENDGHENSNEVSVTTAPVASVTITPDKATTSSGDTMLDVDNDGDSDGKSTKENEIKKNEDDKKKDGDEGEEEDVHEKYDLVIQKSCQTLEGLDTMLKEDDENGGLFCSEARNDEWRKEICDSLANAKQGPKTIVGVLGSTGVGKSSLLNAMLDEAAVLPTSGSRGCTAAVVELTYNHDLVEDNNNTRTATVATITNKQVPVYKGKVEFMKLDDWTKELKLLVDECSTQDTKTIYVKEPDEQTQPDAAAAWAKINQVYGRRTMSDFSGRPSQHVFQRLSTNSRVVKLLTPPPNSTEEYNAVHVQEGLVDIKDADKYLCGYQKMKSLRSRRNLKKWAKSFRSKINDYVYRKGNGDQPQTWPLIRCVQLQGPWACLSSGGVLVDLPGVRDANAARARVAERYLQNCNQIWVVAPIKRAVDDGTAKELMGAEFKRRLLMDGQYGNIAFICTQTDDCEATEIMRDHEDIAITEEGRWEKMIDLRDNINNIETKLSDLQQEEEELKISNEEAKEMLKELKSELKDATTAKTQPNGNSDDNDDDDFIVDDDVVEMSTPKEVDETTIQELKDQIAEQEKKVEETNDALSLWGNLHNAKIGMLDKKCSSLQRRLKAICAKVRNEYSTKCLQEDFIAGLREMYRDAQDGPEENNEVTVPDNVSLPVFCISANDYLKITGIKPSSDGPPNCFSLASDTQIQHLREFVHTTTATRRVAFIENVVNRTSDLVDRVKLLAQDTNSDNCSTRQRIKCQNVFEGEMRSLATKIEPIAKNFLKKAEQKVMCTLKPSLTSGAKKAHSSAMMTVDSWGSKSRRSKHERTIDRNGLYWSTYFATVRRDGIYVSASAGSIDMNAELAAPMEAEYTPAWSSIMDGAVRNLINESERQVVGLLADVDRKLLNGFCDVGVDRARIISMVNISSSNRSNAIRTRFNLMREVATENQRELSRSLLPKVQQSMRQSYANTMNVPSGTGKFNRMKSAMHSTSRIAIDGLFEECMKELLDAIEKMVQNLGDQIDLLKDTISKSLSSIYSILWEDQNTGKTADPAYVQKVLACRAAYLPILTELRKKFDEVMEDMGICRPTPDIELEAVETWEQAYAKKKQEAIANGNLVELSTDSDDSEDDHKQYAMDRKPCVV